MKPVRFSFIVFLLCLCACTKKTSSSDAAESGDTDVFSKDAAQDFEDGTVQPDDASFIADQKDSVQTTDVFSDIYSDSLSDTDMVQKPVWKKGGLIYEVFVRSFFDSDIDGIGDIAGLTEKIPYILSLNAGAVWLMPVFASPSYHGYDVTDYYQINKDYGTMADLEAFISEAHKNNISVILDFVANHTSDQHPFFKDAFGNPDSEYSDFYKFTDADHKNYKSFFGYKNLPELNFDNQDVRNYLINVALFYKAKGVDGFRCDYALGPPLSFWKDLKNAAGKDFILIAEAWLYPGETEDAITPERLAPFYDSGFILTFDFPVFHAITGADKEGKTGQGGWINGKTDSASISGIWKKEKDLFPADSSAVGLLNNHDTDRIASMADSGKKIRLAALLNLGIRNSPLVYYGEEIGMKGLKGSGPFWDEFRREPMDWYAGAKGAGMPAWFSDKNQYNKPDDGISVEEQDKTNESLLNFYRIAAGIRKDSAILSSGTQRETVVSAKNLLAVVRECSQVASCDEAWVLVFNPDNASVAGYGISWETSLKNGDYKSEVILSSQPEEKAGSVTVNSGKVIGYVPFPSVKQCSASWIRFSYSSESLEMPVSEPVVLPTHEVSFSLKDQNYKNVSLVGDFNAWNPQSAAMNKESNFWKIIISPPSSGIHAYKFVVDGTWIKDPANPVSEPDGFGGENSVFYMP
jgi:glycosidase